MARRRHSNRRRRRGNFGFLYKLLSVLVICAAVVMALTLFFRVDTIEVTGTERYTEKDVIEASGIQLGDNLFLLNKYEAARSIAEQLPYIDIEDIRIRRELPDTLLIDVAECGTPLAVIQDGSAWLLSPKGKIVEHGDADDIIERPQNPYTQKLLASLPLPDPVKQREHRAKLHDLLAAQR